MRLPHIMEESISHLLLSPRVRCYEKLCNTFGHVFPNSDVMTTATKEKIGEDAWRSNPL